MNRILTFVAALTLSIPALAIDHIPTDYQILTRPEGPAVAAQLGKIDWSQLTFPDTECRSWVAYAGETKLVFGTETYKLVSIVSATGDICPGTFDMTKYDNLVLQFINVDFGNQIGLSLDKTTMPDIDVILGRGVVVPGKALN